MKVRQYEDYDFDLVVNLFTASVHGLAKDYYTAEQLVAWAPQSPNLADWGHRLSGLQTLVAEDNRELMGFLSYELNGHIDLLFVSPHHSRCGVASALYHQAESKLISSGVEQLFTEASCVAHGFFVSQGFSVQRE